jgi:hypothetical protein
MAAAHVSLASVEVLELRLRANLRLVHDMVRMTRTELCGSLQAVAW